MKVTALVSGYYAENFIETRLINLRKQDCETILICEAGSAEHEVGTQYGVKMVVTNNIPTLYAAWNMGIQAATGDYLVAANTDDLFHDGMLARMAEALDRTNADILYSNYDIKGGKNIEPYTREERKATDIYKICFIGPMPMWRRSLHDRFGMFDESFTIAGDWEFWARCVQRGATLHYLPVSVGVYWSRTDSLEHKDKAQHNAERKRVKEMYG